MSGAEWALILTASALVLSIGERLLRGGGWFGQVTQQGGEFARRLAEVEAKTTHINGLSEWRAGVTESLKRNTDRLETVHGEAKKRDEAMRHDLEASIDRANATFLTKDTHRDFMARFLRVEDWCLSNGHARHRLDEEGRS